MRTLAELSNYVWPVVCVHIGSTIFRIFTPYPTTNQVELDKFNSNRMYWESFGQGEYLNAIFAQPVGFKR